MIPSHRLLEIERGEDNEHDQGNDLLNRLELCGVENAVADPVRGNLKTVFEERYHPADDNDREKRLVLVLEMPVPGECHENIGYGQEKDRSHAVPIPAPTVSVINGPR